MRRTAGVVRVSFRPMRIEVLHNPIAGAGRANQAARELARACEDAGHHVTLRETSRNGADASAANHDDRTELIVVVGGDGTIRAAAPEAIRRKIPIYHYPFGTENLFSRQFGMNRESATLLSAIERGEVRAMDVAYANDHLFVLMVSVGFDAAVVADLAEHRRGAIKHTSYIMPTIRQLWSWRPPRLTVRIDGREVVTSQVGTLLIANSPEYALRFNPARDASMTDGALDVVFFPLRSRFGLIPWAWRVWRGTHFRHPALVRGRGEHVEVRAEPTAAFQLDGDAALNADGMASSTPIHARAEAAQLQVLIPPVK